MNNETINETNETPPSISFETMTALHEMRQNNTLCDATIKLDDNSEFIVHRVLLSSCSSYFRAFFTSALTIASDGKTVFTISGISRMAMEKIISYAYMRQCDITEINVHEILVIADYVGILGLVRKCVEFLKNNLKPENCINVWLFSR